MISVAGRIRRIFSGLKADMLLISNSSTVDSNFLYLTGFTSGIFEHAILIVAPGKEVLITNPLEYEIARRQHPKEMEVVNAKGKGEIVRVMQKYMRGKTVGINGEYLPVNYYRKLKLHSRAKRFVDASAALSKARAVKDAVEIARIRTANRIILRVLREMPRHFKAGVTEKQLAARIEYLMREYGADGPSFPPIVCFGENAALPHHMPEDARLEKNTLVLLDCGAKYKNYSSDVTRTFIFRPDKRSAKYRKMSRIHEVVAAAQRLGLARIRPGVKGRTPHGEVEKYIDTVDGGAYKGKFIHSLGHSLGIDVHDLGPGLTPLTEEALAENMVVSDEPGIYIVGFGGVRIEDDVVVAKKGGRFI